jgi:hypothetical protein
MLPDSASSSTEQQVAHHETPAARLTGRQASKMSEPEFQQAKKSKKGAEFLQIVAEPNRRNRRKGKQRKQQHKLTRIAFSVSRLMEFCTIRELQNQTGHSVYEWPLVVGKEIFDNALDAAEEAERAPVIEVIVNPGSISIQDNAGGFAASTIESILDYSVRVSSREAYISPTRGAQGRANRPLGAALDIIMGCAP